MLVMAVAGVALANAVGQKFIDIEDTMHAVPVPHPYPENGAM